MKRVMITKNSVMKIQDLVMNQESRTFKSDPEIFNKLNCKSYRLIYLLQCQICHLQYVSIRDTAFNLCELYLIAFNFNLLGKHRKKTV